jgi:ubiquinone/menaquinone biosynthesis C-methylase UbiE
MKDTIRSEFTRQAEPMASAASFHAASDMLRLVKAVRSAAPARLLDVACGPGIVAEALSPYVQELIGMDATPGMIRLAQKRFNEAHLLNGCFQVAWAESLPFEAGGFDAVVTRLSLHHFTDLPSVLREMRRVLRPHGQLIVADVLSSDDPVESALHNAVEQLRDPTHVRMLSKAELTHSIRSEGFELVSQESWEHERSFTEWAQIVSAPARTDPLRRVMMAFARNGQRLGINLREESGKLKFTHTWLMVVARAE